MNQNPNEVKRFSITAIETRDLQRGNLGRIPSPFFKNDRIYTNDFNTVIVNSFLDDENLIGLGIPLPYVQEDSINVFVREKKEITDEEIKKYPFFNILAEQLFLIDGKTLSTMKNKSVFTIVWKECFGNFVNLARWHEEKTLKKKLVKIDDCVSEMAIFIVSDDPIDIKDFQVMKEELTFLYMVLEKPIKEKLLLDENT